LPFSSALPLGRDIVFDESIKEASARKKLQSISSQCLPTGARAKSWGGSRGGTLVLLDAWDRLIRQATVGANHAWPHGEGRTLSLYLKPVSKAMYCEQCGSRCQ
jgi:hypothetical protein